MCTVRLVNYFGLCTIPSHCSNFNCCSTPSSRWQRHWLKPFLFKYTIVISIMSQLWANKHMNILTTSACRKFICKCIQSQRANLVAMSTVNFLLPNFSSHPLQYHIGNRENWWWVILNQFDDFVPHRRIKSPPIFDSQLI